MTLWKTRFAAALTIGLTVVACSLDDLVPAGSFGIDDGASGGAKQSYKVDSETEVRIEIEETGAALSVPKGAVEHSVTIGVERPSDAKAIEFVESLKTVKAVASAPYVLTPHGTEFTKDLKLQIPVASNKGKPLVAAYLKDESDRKWKYLDTPVVEGDVATVTLKHFSVVVLLDRARSGLEEEIPDAGSSARPDDDEVAEAGAAGEPLRPVDDVDAGSTMGADGDGDAAPNGSLDAAVPAVADAGVGVTFDGGSNDPDAETPPPGDGEPDTTEAGQELADAGNLSDASIVTPPDPDGSYDVPPACEPLVCAVDDCGSVPDGCGGEMACGDCEYYGGVCNYDQHRCEYIGL